MIMVSGCCCCFCTGQASTVGSPQGLFPGNMIHLGGDEVDADCFNRDPEIAAWMASQANESERERETVRERERESEQEQESEQAPE